MGPDTAREHSGPFTPESPPSTPDPPLTQPVTESQQDIPRLSVASLRAASLTAPRGAVPGSPAIGSSGNLPDSFRLSPRGAFYQPRTLTGAPLLDLKRDGSGTASPAPRKSRATMEPATPLPAGTHAQRREGIPRASSDGKVRSRRHRSASIGTPASAGRAELIPGPVQPGEVFLPPPFIALRAIERYGEAKVTFKVERSSMGPTYGTRGAFGVSDPESPAIKVSYKEPLGAEESEVKGAELVPGGAALRGAAGGTAPLLPIADVAEVEEGDGHATAGAGGVGASELEGGAPGPAPPAPPRAARSDKPSSAACRSLGDLMSWIGSLGVSNVHRIPRRPSSPESPAS